ncbi:MAG: D-2-hydroxyacid dehydrogenase [Chloroflexi bacterium]|nr:D-2-hydroxyacid dehydrogenase [Chloroflexota bacterium]
MVNVLIVSKVYMPVSFLKDIQAVDPSVRVTNGTSLYLQELHRDGNTEPYVRRFEQEVERDLAEGAPPFEAGQTLDSLLTEADVAFAQHFFPKDLAARAPKLRWIQVGGVGLNRVIGHDVFNRRVSVTNAAGALASPIAEHVMTFILMHAKSMPRLMRQQAERRWHRFEVIEVADKTVGIIGMGAISHQVAQRARCFGMRVIATRRSATARARNVDCYDEVFPLASLPDMLGESDFVVLALPLTEESRNLISERELRAMKPTACIVNVSRGPIIDQPVLIRALREGWIHGAGLDVAAEEPMPAEADLWEAPNLILSPHMAGHTEMRVKWVSRQFCENLRRFIAGEPLINVVTREKGY